MKALVNTRRPICSSCFGNPELVDCFDLVQFVDEDLVFIADSGLFGDKVDEEMYERVDDGRCYICS